MAARTITVELEVDQASLRRTTWDFRQIVACAMQAYVATLPDVTFTYRPWLPLHKRLAMRAES